MTGMRLARHRVGGDVVRVVFTDSDDGDFAIDRSPGELSATRTDLIDLPWTWLRQVHGAEVVPVAAPGDGVGSSADASYSSEPGAVLCVQTADCVPVALIPAVGPVGVVHAGWRGLEAGVITSTVAALRSAGAVDIEAIVGAHIRPACYEFGASDLERLSDAFGDAVVSVSSRGTPALDLSAMVRHTLEAADVRRVRFVGGCTACGDRWHSHRSRGDTARQTLAVWIDPNIGDTPSGTAQAGLSRFGATEAGRP